MILKYEIDIDKDIVAARLKKITNEIYKLLPNREEGIDWIKPLKTIMEELAGMNRLFCGEQDIFLPLICKLEGLFTLTKEEDFLLFRGTIFECLSLMEQLKEKCL